MKIALVSGKICYGASRRALKKPVISGISSNMAASGAGLT